MKEQIIRFLLEAHTDKKSDKAVRKLIAERFGGEVVKQYVKIDGIEYLIRRDPDCMNCGFCGFEVRQIDWNHGNDWRFYSPY